MIYEHHERLVIKKADGGKLYEEIQNLIVLIWNMEGLTQKWKEYIIVTIHKKCDKLDGNNYKGLSFPLA